jgi:hypothetical protein
MQTWHTWEDILHFAQTLDSANGTGFMIVLSAVSWSIWKHRNEVCFTNCHIKTARSLILLIKTLCGYWTGALKKKVKDVVGEWLPVIEDAIPLAQYMPMEMVVYQPAVDSDGGPPAMT